MAIRWPATIPSAPLEISADAPFRNGVVILWSQRSTWFSQLAEVGVKWTCQCGQRANAGGGPVRP